MRFPRVLAAVLVLLAVACGDDDGPAVDAGAIDAGRSDAGPTDGGLPDLTVLGDRATASARVEWTYFAPDSCAIADGCIVEAGWRRVLRFATVTANVGTGDLHLGVPAETPGFVYSECHDHYHFDGYADYRLLDDDGTEVGSGHKQAFCLRDSERISTSDPTVERIERYSCEDQGIQRGWADTYNASLDCQWVDVTDVAPGDYTLRITVNASRAIAELDYDNDVASVGVTVPADMPDPDPTTPCAGTETGPYRSCGFDVRASGLSCVPGAEYDAGCGAMCGLGDASACMNDPVIRVCEGAEPCGGRASLANDDDSCGDGICPRARFTCPVSGTVTLLTGSWDPSATYRCDAVLALVP